MPLPPETVDQIIDLVDNHRTLQACSLVAKSWVGRSRMHLFRNVVFFSLQRWQKVMPLGDASPAKYTRTLTFAQGETGRWIDTDNLYSFFSHLRDFKNVENLILNGWIPARFSEGGLKKYFGHFGGRLRTLELSGERLSPDRFLVLLSLLPNLEDLSVREVVGGTGEVRVPAVSPKFSGRLTVWVYDAALFRTLAKIPLRFREICLQEHGCIYQELLDACAETLVDFRAISLDRGATTGISFVKCQKLIEVTLLKKSIQTETYDISDIVSTITSRHIQRIVIGFGDRITDEGLEFAIEDKDWQKVDDAMTSLAEQTLNHGRKLQLELHFWGDSSVELFDSIFPRFIESGSFKVVKASYIWRAFLSGPSAHGLRNGQEML